MAPPPRPRNPSPPPPPPAPPSPPPPSHDHPTPLLRLKIEDLSKPGAGRFLHSVDASRVLQDSTTAVLTLLYPAPYSPQWPGTRSVTLVLDSHSGVAYTTGKSLDDDHKEIHFSTGYIESVAPERLTDELTGVVVHEMVHCWQWNGCGAAPGGLIEGIADWVRLKAGLAPPHWRRRGTETDRWDAGYDATAYFLDWLEEQYGDGTVPRVNGALKEREYVEAKFWEHDCGFGKTVDVLWKEYTSSLGSNSSSSSVGEEQEGEKKKEKKGDVAEEKKNEAVELGDGQGAKEINGEESGTAQKKKPNTSSRPSTSHGEEDGRSPKQKIVAEKSA